MKLYEYTENSIDVLRLRGEVDIHYAPVLRALLKTKAKGRCRKLLLDMSAVSYVDSSGLSAILEYLRDATKFGGCFCIGGVGKQLSAIFETIHLTKLMPIFADAGEAKKALAFNRVPTPSKRIFAPAE